MYVKSSIHPGYVGPPSARRSLFYQGWVHSIPSVTRMQRMDIIFSLLFSVMWSPVYTCDFWCDFAYKARCPGLSSHYAWSRNTATHKVSINWKEWCRQIICDYFLSNIHAARHPSHAKTGPTSGSKSGHMSPTMPHFHLQRKHAHIFGHVKAPCKLQRHSKSGWNTQQGL